MKTSDSVILMFLEGGRSTWRRFKRQRSCNFRLKYPGFGRFLETRCHHKMERRLEPVRSASSSDTQWAVEQEMFLSRMLTIETAEDLWKDSGMRCCYMELCAYTSQAVWTLVEKLCEGDTHLGIDYKELERREDPLELLFVLEMVIGRAQTTGRGLRGLDAAWRNLGGKTDDGSA